MFLHTAQIRGSSDFPSLNIRWKLTLSGTQPYLRIQGDWLDVNSGFSFKKQRRNMSSRLTRPTIASQQKAQPKKPYVGLGTFISKNPNKSFASPQFNWQVNEENGYFELEGHPPEPDDDCYILDTTLVSCEYFHLLEGRRHDGRHYESCHWKVQFREFGCDLYSDVFTLSSEHENRDTFIGDKITAKIRCNGALFHEYLKSTSIEFRVFRAVGENGTHRLVGISFVELKDLTKPDIKGLKAKLDIIPQGDFEPTVLKVASKKPELRVVVEMSVHPNFFSEEESIQEVAGEVPVVPDDEHDDDVKSCHSEGLIKENQTKEGDGDDTLDTQDREIDVVGDGVLATKTVNDRSPFHMVTNKEFSNIETARGESSDTRKNDPTPIGGSSEADHADLNASPAGGDTMDGLAASRPKPAAEEEMNNKTTQKVENNLANWSKDEIIKFKEELQEKERAYLQILQDEWRQRDEEREQKTTNIILEQETLKSKLEAKETYLEEMEYSLRKREKEVEEFANKATLELTHRVDEMKLKMSFMKDKNKNDLELSNVKLESAYAEVDRLTAKIESLQTKLSAKEDQIDELNAMRTHWPDISLERKLLRLEEKNKTLTAELTKVTRERDSYRNGATVMAEHLGLAKRELAILRNNETESLRAQLLLNEERKDLREGREVTAELAKSLASLKKSYSVTDKNIQQANLLTEKIDKRNRSPPIIPVYTAEHSPSSMSSVVSDAKKYLKPSELSKMTCEEINAEISRLVSERDRMIGTGKVRRTNPIIQNLDNALTRLASGLQTREQIRIH